MKSSKNQRLRQRVSADVKHFKQATLDGTPQPSKEKHADAIDQAPKKTIEIVDVATCTREDELEFKVAFKLVPSRKGSFVY